MQNDIPLHIVHLDRASMGDDLSLVRPYCAHQWTSYDVTLKEQDAHSRLKDADIAILNKVPITKSLLEQASQLKMIALSATGYNHIDLAACKERGIVVCNVRGYATTSVPEHTFALMLSLRRALKAYDAELKHGVWHKSDTFCLFTQPVSDLKGSCLGLIGCGDIGAEVARLAQAFGMRVIKADRKGAVHIREGYVDFDQMIEEADIISLHCPLNAHTKHILGAKEFAKMKRAPVIINTSRGGLVDEEALIDALDKRLISAAGFDVLTTEPPEEGALLLTQLERPNLIVTPHSAWASSEARLQLWGQLISQIDTFAAGQPIHNLCDEV